MKKYSLLMGLMCAALSITSCSKDNTETFDKPKGYEFELYAAPQTRTEVDGLDMKWSADDAMNVFHAPTGTTNYSSNDQFTLAEIESGRFTGLITDTEFDPNGTYDWYAVYPYSKYMASPAESNSGSYFTVGSEAGSAQQQTGIDNQAHISGENIPLYGTATGVTGSPKLQMHHITTLFRINVINSGSADLNVTSITLTSASENLIGTYYFDITGAAPVLTSSGDKYVSKTAKLTITDGIVTPGTTGSFYLATRAFTAPEGEQLTLTVTANGETVEKVATLSKETTFAAGNINKLNIDIEGKEVVGLSLPFTDDFSWANGNETASTPTDLEDYPDGKYTATQKVFQGIGYLKFGSSSSGESNRGYFTTAGLDLSEPFSVIVNAAQYGSDNSTLDITIGETTQSADLNATAQDYVFNFEPQGNNTTVTVKIGGKRGYIYRLDIIKGHEVTLPPALEITSPATISVGQEGDIATITYNVQNPVEGVSVTAEADVDWINSFDYTTSGEVSFIVDTNNDASRTGVVTLSYEGAESKTVTIQQNGVGEIIYDFSVNTTSVWDVLLPTSYTTTETAYTYLEDSSVWKFYNHQYIGSSTKEIQFKSGSGYLITPTFSTAVTSIVIKGGNATMGGKAAAKIYSSIDNYSEAIGDATVVVSEKTYTFDLTSQVAGTSYKITFSGAAGHMQTITIK